MRHNEDISREDFAHRPVMLDEVLEFARGASGGDMLVDCTVGEGGHSQALLENFPGIALTGFERDAQILEVARPRLEPLGSVTLINDNFAHVSSHLEGARGRVRLFLYDFGISSYHFDRSGRGFSFRDDEPLDMRLDDSCERDAAQLVNTLPEKELTEIIQVYGEERWARRIARAIIRERNSKLIRTSKELAQIVVGAIPARYRVKNIHPATRVFQALRIVVNDELEAIRTTLGEAVSLLAPGGRIIAISFHSLEDRIVKTEFRRMARGCVCGNEPPRCACTVAPMISILTKRPLVPGEAETAENKRARSAKMRVCEKLPHPGA
ncbi:MAG: 16S rRNA (cytosine(1402)-N(4))-methyltransferase RsmH [Spirochaetes bacterium]|nr:MAG: 16S rRNA (cytosine(1402)-N(4))-methyltransferase RsmH [Spirochaetota bacterium]